MKELREDKKIFLNVARYLNQMYSDYSSEKEFSYSIIVDKKTKTLKLKFKRKK